MCGVGVMDKIVGMDLRVEKLKAYDKGFQEGQRSKQAEVDELKREMLNKTNEAYAGGQKSMRKMIKSNEDELQKRINEALSCEDKCTWNIALVELKKILKGNTNDH